MGVKKCKDQKPSSLPPGMSLGNGLQPGQPRSDVTPGPGRKACGGQVWLPNGQVTRRSFTMLLCILKSPGDGPVGGGW